MITFEDIKNNEEIRAYIENADKIMKTMGFTEHSVAHVTKVALDASSILSTLGYTERICELAKIAGFMHDIGNSVNRIEHAQSGAIMAFNVLTRLGMAPEEIAVIISAIGNHDESTAAAVNEVAAALILADKSDVRRTRVRIDNRNTRDFDIHDRVNYSVYSSGLEIDPIHMTALLKIDIDTDFCAVMDYFEIFLGRMVLCKKAAEFLHLRFRLTINGTELL